MGYVGDGKNLLTQSQLEAVQEEGKAKRYGVYVGLDVHKETIAVAIARPGGTSRNPGERSPTRARRWES